jgi:Domain of unknown function (DUF4397)
MNLRIAFVSAISATMIFGSCSKTANPASPASIVVVNAIPDANSLYFLFSKDAPMYFQSAQSIGYGGGAIYTPQAGERSLYVIQSTDTTKSIFTGSLNLTTGGIYSLFFSGDTTRPDTLLVQDNIRNYNNDSAGVRFVNLSIGGKSLSINIEGGTPGDIASLSYKGVSGFKTFSSDINGPGAYNFEIRDPLTGDLLTTYSWYYTDHKNNTIVISGSPDPASATPLYLFQINHFY